MNIIKPLTLGCLQRTFSRGGQHYFCVSALGFFSLNGESNTFLIEGPQWKTALKHIPKGQALDLAMPKAKSEFILGGSAYAPCPNTTNRLVVSAEVGKLKKSILVQGDRQWYYGVLGSLHISQPLPFTKIPLSYENAFGGESFKANPEGKGYYRNRLAWLIGKNKGDMPNLEYPGHPIKQHFKQSTPAAFGPLAIQHHFDAELAGTYNEDWLNNHFPGFPADLDLSLFNMAAADQQRPGPWESGEAYALHGMHPENHVIRGCLPRFRATALIQRDWRGEKSIQQNDLLPDTVWFFPEDNLGLIIYRGVFDIADSDGFDVKSLLLAYEDADSVRRTKGHYEDTLFRRLNRQSNPAEVLNEAPLIPEHSKISAPATTDSEVELRAKSLKSAIQKELEPNIPNSDTSSDHGDNKSGKCESPELEIEIPSELTTPLGQDDIASGGVDLSKALTELNEKIEHLRQEKEKELQEEKKQLDELIFRLESDDTRAANEKQALDNAIARAGILPPDLHSDNDNSGKDQSDFLKKISSQQNQEQTNSEKELIRLNALHREALTRQTTVDDERPRLSTENGKRLGCWFMSAVHPVGAFAGRDFSDIVLHDIDFSGCNLSETNFQGADLSNCKFRRSILRKTNFLGAKLTHCDFSGADLSAANLSQALCTNAVFNAATLDSTSMTKIDLSGASLCNSILNKVIAPEANLSFANFTSARITKTVLMESSANNSNWTDALLEKTVFTNSTLEAAVFSGATITRCILNNINGQGSNWDNCESTRCFYGGNSTLSESSWRHVLFKTCGMRESNFENASMPGATFFQCDFSKSSFKNTDMSDSVLCRSLFTSSDLCSATLKNADLHQAIFRKANFNDANLMGANLVETDLVGAVTKNANLEHIIDKVA